MKQITFTVALTLLSHLTMSQFQPNYDESKIPDYTLPEILKDEKGGPVKSVKKWEQSRRPEILDLFKSQMFGVTPSGDYSLDFKVTKDQITSVNGTAILKEVVITVKTSNGELPIHLLLFIPKESNGPVPCVTALNFQGNHTVHPDPNITLAKGWVRNNDEIGVTDNKSTDQSRGLISNRWDVEKIISRGYALATVYYGDLDPDYDDGFQNGLHPLFYTSGQATPKPEEWASIGAWAFGLSRIMDYLVTDPAIDHERVAVMGHSRLGKAALWAGVNDTRFSLVISNSSGCGGAALSKRKIGETVGRINTQFPHWFCDNFNQYNDNELSLPFDQHMLLAMVAPRPLYVASAEEDLWADPRGEFMSLYHARAVYELYGEKAISTSAMPAIEKPLIDGKTGYHIRTGKHDVTDYDWAQYLNFMDMHLK